MLPVSVYAQLSYMDNGDGTATITGCDQNYSGAAIIPDSTSGLPVTGIWYNAFMGCTGLTSVTISTNVTSIGVYCIRIPAPAWAASRLPKQASPASGTMHSDSCASLSSITIPNHVTSIGDRIHSEFLQHPGQRHDPQQRH